MSVTTNEVTTGELGRRFDRFERTVTDALQGIAGKLDDRPGREDVLVLLKPLEARISVLEGWQTWTLRLGAPALVGSLVGVAVNAIKLNSGG